jgi:hypothetical protein
MQEAPMADTVTLTLAHPLGGPSCDRLGIPRRDYGVGEPLDLTRDAANTLIAAGYAAGVDPEDPDQVRAALGASRGVGGTPAGTPAGTGAGPVPAGDNPAGNPPGNPGGDYPAGDTE